MTIILFFKNSVIYMHVLFLSLLQLMSQKTGGAVEDLIMLDVHSIAELQDKKVPSTDDSPKYKYTSNSDGDYG